MKNNDRAFVEAVFDSKTKKEIDEIVNKNISQDMFYNSPVVEHIRGNMSHVLHCTIYHGLSPEAIQNEELEEIMASHATQELELGRLSLLDGYENLYKVLVVEVLDKGKKLHKFNEAISEYAEKYYGRVSRREFLPHVTLAYVQSSFEIPAEMRLPEKLEVSKVRCSLVSEFNKSANA